MARLCVATESLETKMRTLTILLLTAASVVAQDRTATVTIKDVSSPAQQFLTFSGTASFKEHRDADQVIFTRIGSATLTNVSGQPIMAIVAKFTTTAFRETGSMSYIHDFFFKSEPLAPGATHDIPLRSMQLGPHKINAIPDTPPSFEVRVQFVQLADGTTWGDSAVAATIASYRKDVSDFLARLLEIYNSQGATALANEIQADRSDTSIAITPVRQGMVQMYTHSGIEAVLADIKNRQRIAAAYEATGKF